MRLNQFLAEGGAALKVAPVTQAEARALLPSLTSQVSAALGIPLDKVVHIGSAGKRPLDDETSGDIDLAVEASFEACEAILKRLAYDGKTFRVMKGINVLSFAAKIGSKVVQIDLMPTNDVTFVGWSSQANQADLKAGLKGSHRNELFFAVAKHANRKVLKQDERGEPLSLERWFYDLHKGLLRGKSSREGKQKNLKNFKTHEKVPVSKDPKRITKLLFGLGPSPADVETFSGTLAAIMADTFPWPELRADILATARTGMERKGLKVPLELKQS